MIEPMKKLKFNYFSCVILQAIFKYTMITMSCWMLRYLRSCQRFTHNFFYLNRFFAYFFPVFICGRLVFFSMMISWLMSLYLERNISFLSCMLALLTLAEPVGSSLWDWWMMIRNSCWTLTLIRLLQKRTGKNGEISRENEK